SAAERGASTIAIREGCEHLRRFHKRQRRRRCRPGRSSSARNRSRTFANRPEHPRWFEERRSASSRSADERAKKIRATGRAQTFPVLEALIEPVRLGLIAASLV